MPLTTQIFPQLAAGLRGLKRWLPLRQVHWGVCKRGANLPGHCTPLASPRLKLEPQTRLLWISSQEDRASCKGRAIYRGRSPKSFIDPTVCACGGRPRYRGDSVSRKHFLGLRSSMDCLMKLLVSGNSERTATRSGLVAGSSFQKRLSQMA